MPVSDVATLVSAPIVAETRARGLDPQLLVSGLDVMLPVVEDPHGRMSWPVFVEFADRATKMLGRDTLEELAAAATLEYTPKPIRRVLPQLRDSRTLFTLAPRWWGPWVFRGTWGRCERLPDGRLREIVRILPGYSACPEFFEGLRGTLRGMPRLLNQPDALVTMDHDGREGEFIITPPPRRARRWWRRTGSWLGEGRETKGQQARAERDLEELGFAREQLLDSHSRVRSLAARIDEQSRQLQVLEQLRRALVGEVDVDHGGLQSQLAGFLRRLLGVTGVRLSHLEREIGANHEDASGFVAGAPDRTVTLGIGGRRVGLLELWGVAAMKTPELLDSLYPWLAFAVEFSGSKSQVTELTRLVTEDLKDWQTMERSLEQLVMGRVEPIADTGRARTLGNATGAFDLAGFLRGLTPRVRKRFRDDVGLDLQCEDDLWTTLSEGRQLDSFVWEVLVIFGDIGSKQVRIQSRAIPGRARSGLECMLAEIVISGRGGLLDAGARRRLHGALEYVDSGVIVPDLDVRTDADGSVWVRVCVPLLTRVATGRPH
jgi:hypothetical protein